MRWRRARRRGALTLAAGLLSVCALAAAPGAAAATPFHNGDVFLTGSGSVQEYTPAGRLVQTVPGSSGAQSLCFDPAGRYLVVPGVGLFDRFGDLLPSSWASVPHDRCVADRAGNVYVTDGAPGGGTATLWRYDVDGNLRQTYALPFAGTGIGLGIDLAPDGCTLYYGAWDEVSVPSNGIARFDVCTNTPDPSYSTYAFNDDLRVLPSGQVLVTDDAGGFRFDTSGQEISQYFPPQFTLSNSLRTMSLDPDGRTFWMSGSQGVTRFDIRTGTEVTLWCTSAATFNAGRGCNLLLPDANGAIAVYARSHHDRDFDRFGHHRWERRRFRLR